MRIESPVQRSVAMDELLVRHRFTIEDYHRMGEAGVFEPDAKVELLRGEVVEMTPIGNRHCVSVDLFTRLFSRRVGEHGGVRVQQPIELPPDSEPEPDLAIVRLPLEQYAEEHHPRPDDVLLLVEVAESSVKKDRRLKLPLYAEHGIAEVWIVDLPAGVIDVFTSPKDGTYTAQRTTRPGDAIVPTAFPDASFDPAEFLLVRK